MDRAATHKFTLLASFLGLSLLSIAKEIDGKQCTNTGVSSSHTLRALQIPLYQSPTFTSSPNSTRNCPKPHHNAILGQTHKPQPSNSAFLQPISLHNVTLAEDSPQGIAQFTNLRYLLMLDLDSLLWNFRKTAGLEAAGSPYGGWESPNSELRGHFVGHYLSGTALMWASTHYPVLLERMNALVDALAECQNEIGTGYLSAFPSELFNRFEALQPVWAPYYTIHKVLAGLLDQYTYAGNQKALGMAQWMTAYFYNRVQIVIEKYTIERHWQSLNEETGGMNDVLYRLYIITADSLSGFHTNTHIPVVVGAQMRYEVVGDKLYKDISKFFWKIVNSAHRFVTGGTSSGEFWSDPHRLGDALHTEDEESCTTYNMLKVARNLFRWTKKIIYADYYERAILNGVLSIQRGQEPGVMIYMLPLGAGNSKAVSYHGWGTPFDSFWCCYGTGIESFSKLGDSIYFQEESDLPSLYVIQFVSTKLFWEETGLLINQSVSSPTSYNPELRVTFIFTIPDQSYGLKAVEAVFNVRVPSWTTLAGCWAALNGESIDVPAPGSFLTIQRNWVEKDQLVVAFPATLAAERVQDDRAEFSSLHAILFGPYVLAGISDGEKSFGSAMNLSSLSDWIIPVAPSSSNELYTFSQDLSGFQEISSSQIKNSLSKGTEYRSILDNPSYVLTHKSGLIVMNPLPSKGTNSAVSSTFRMSAPLINISLNDGSLSANSYLCLHCSNLVYRTVSLELFDHPGSYLAHKGKDAANITVIWIPPQADRTPADDLSNAVFHILPSLSGDEDKISFQAASMDDCYISAPNNTSSGGAVQLHCSRSRDDTTFNQAASFSVKEGLSTYHPMSFIAQGFTRNYLLCPLSAYWDESYTVYFDMAA